MNYKQEKDKNTTPTTAENQRQMKKKIMAASIGEKFLLLSKDWS